MRVVWNHAVSVRPHPDLPLIDLKPGEPFDMPDEEALARIAQGDVEPFDRAELAPEAEPQVVEKPARKSKQTTSDPDTSQPTEGAA